MSKNRDLERLWKCNGTKSCSAYTTAITLIPEFHQRHRGVCVGWGPALRPRGWESSGSSTEWSKHRCGPAEHEPARQETDKFTRTEPFLVRESNFMTATGCCCCTVRNFGGEKENLRLPHPASVWVQEEVFKGELWLAEIRLNMVTSSVCNT